MTDDVRELLPLYALGILEPAEARVVERAVAADPALAAELARYQDSASELVGPDEAIAPAAATHARLLASIGGGRFEALAARVGAMFDVTVDAARELLGLIERPASWIDEMPGIALVHFDGGPAHAAADCGFVRLAAGATFPPHKHLGEEATLILQGSLRDATTGALHGPGDAVVHREGTEHYLVCEGTEACIYAARATNGIEVAGVPARPSRPKL